MDIDRVSFFRDAMAASAPIVLDLSPTAGFKEFFNALSSIGEAIVKDSKLPKKLVSLQIPHPKVTWILGPSCACISVRCHLRWFPRVIHVALADVTQDPGKGCALFGAEAWWNISNDWWNISNDLAPACG